MSVIPMPCHAVIFVSKRSDVTEGYNEALERMSELGVAQPGFLGITSARSPDGAGITVVFYDTAEAAKQWGRHPEHREVIRTAIERHWYDSYSIYYTEVAGGHTWTRPDSSA